MTFLKVHGVFEGHTVLKENAGTDRRAYKVNAQNLE